MFAIADAASFDPIVRCGVGWASFPVSYGGTIACRVHDYEYSSTAYQYYHSRAEADAQLESNLTKLGYPVTAKIFNAIVRVVGGIFWDNKKTK